MSGFTTSNGKIYDPHGVEFIASGINVMNGNGNPSAATLQADFPGINFVRLAIFNYDSPDSLKSYVNDLTSHGLVVDLENHNNNSGSAGGSQGVIFSGDALQKEQNWYSSIATAFKDNPNVWFGTNNEPSETDPDTGNMNASRLSDWQKSTYDSIRNAGNNNPILLEANSSGPGKTMTGYNAGDYAQMHNTIWDMHYYGWLSGFSTDQNTVTNTLTSLVSDTHAITNADGTMPDLIGEFGDSTNGQQVDANGTQVVKAVLDSGVSSAAWAWGSGGPGDGLTDGGNGLSDYGKTVAAGIATDAAARPAASGRGTPSPSATQASASASGSIVLAGATGTITDTSSNTWSINSGVVQENGNPAGYSANVKEIAYVNGAVWQQNTDGNWWSWNGTAWPGDGVATSPMTSDGDKTIVAGSTGTITDAHGGQWTINNGVVQLNGAAAGYSANVAQLSYVNGTVWQQNTDGNWWSWNGTTWPGDGVLANPLVSGLPAVDASTTMGAPAAGSPDMVNVTAGHTVQPVTVPGTVSGDTFSLTDAGMTVAKLGSTPTFVHVAGSSGVSVTGGSAPAMVVAASGTNSFTTGGPYLDVTGGSGADAYTFTGQSGVLSIEDFNAAKGDTLSIKASLQSEMKTTNSGHDTMLTFGSGSSIALYNVTDTPTIHWN